MMLTKVRDSRVLLPTGWPVLFLFVVYPLWWLLGLSGFIWAAAAVPMGLRLLRTRPVRMPKGFGIWLLFLAWMFASIITIDESTRFMVAIHRASLYVSATVLFLYIYNLGPTFSPRFVGALAFFWAGVVIVGLLALAWPSLEIVSVAERMMPGSLLRTGYVIDLVHVRLAQIHEFLGFPVGRPTGPFAYTNQWGSAFALALPFAYVARTVHPRPWRWLFPLLALLGLVPLVVSLDRGSWLSLIAAGLYVAFRLMLRLRVGTVAKAAAGLFMVTGIVLATPLGGLVVDRIETPHSNEGRLEVYSQVVDGVAESPIFGYGGPQEAVGRYLPQLGTQGAFWLVLYSSGIPGAALFVGFLLSVVWRSRRDTHSFAFAAHVTVVIALVQMPYYGFLPAGIHVVLAASSLTLLGASGVGVAPGGRSTRARRFAP